MSKHILIDWEDDVDELSILLLLSSLEDYRLAFELNKTFGYSFSACLTDICKTNKKSQYYFRSYHSFDSNNNASLYLIENQSYSSSNPVSSGGLFETETHLTEYLLPKFSKWPFILVSEDLNSLNSFTKSTLQSTITAKQLVDFKDLRSNEQNIFTHYYYENQR